MVPLGRFRKSLVPGLGPWGAKASDRTGQGRVGVVTSTSTQLSRLPVGERGGEMSGDEKPEPFKRKGMITVKPRQESQKTERRDDVKRSINEELEIYEKCYRFFKRTSSKIIRGYTAEQILRRAANLRGEK
jgi:hypothetical protein